MTLILNILIARFLSLSISSITAMGQPSSRSESEYSDGTSDIDMEDGMVRSGTDGISPDEGSDDYSFMSIGSSDDNSGIRRKHRPKSLNLSRSISATSSEDETSDSAISTDVESKYSGAAVSVSADSHELRIALAAKGFVEDMRGVDMANDTDEEVAEITATESNDEGNVKFSPSAPVSPSWREGLDSPPFSPRRRDSYPGKRRGSSPVSPKDKRFTYSEMSPPHRQLSDEKLYDKDGHILNHDHIQYAQSISPKSPDDSDESYYGAAGELIPIDRPTSNLKKSKPFYSLEDATEDDTPTVMDLATYAATVASNTANLTSLTVSPPNVETDHEKNVVRRESPESLESSSPVSPTYYDNLHYGENEEQTTDEDIELADPSQKAIDYQGSKRQKARPPTTDWSPVIDLSPILDVSPSLEEAEQAEMLAQQQEERERQASREDVNYSPDHDIGSLAEGATDTEYAYYGLKRYEVVEDISELLKENNGMYSPDMCSHNSDNSDNWGTPSESEASESYSSNPTSEITNRDLSSQGGSNPKGIASNPGNGLRKKDSSAEKPLVETKTSKQADDNTNKLSNNGTKVRRKLPEPTNETEVQKPPVPKPRRKDRPPEPPPGTHKTSTVSKQETKEPSRNAPILNNPKHPKTSRQVLQKQDSDERSKTAKQIKGKSDPVVTNHVQSEEASSLCQYRVLESPPSPENKSVIRREYSDSTSVSPSSSPDREIYLYPSPVTPPDSDSSPPKPHSPSSGTDFEEELLFTEAPLSMHKSKHKDATRSASSASVKKNPDIKPQKERHVHERVQAFEKVRYITILL